MRCKDGILFTYFEGKKCYHPYISRELVDIFVKMRVLCDINVLTNCAVALKNALFDFDITNICNQCSPPTNYAFIVRKSAQETRGAECFTF